MDKTTIEDVADRIRDVMRDAGLTIEQFAAELGEKPQRVKDVLRGKQRVPADMLAALARMKGVDIGYVITGKHDPASTIKYNDAIRIAQQVQKGVAELGASLKRPPVADDEEELLGDYRRADRHGKADIRRAAKAAAKGYLQATSQHVSADRGSIAAGRDVSVGSKPRRRRK